MNPFIPDHVKLVTAIRAIMAASPDHWFTTQGVCNQVRECSHLAHIDLRVGDVRLTLLELRSVGHLDMGLDKEDTIRWRISEDSVNGRIPEVMV